MLHIDNKVSVSVIHRTSQDCLVNMVYCRRSQAIHALHLAPWLFKILPVDIPYLTLIPMCLYNVTLFRFCFLSYVVFISRA